MEQPPLIDMTGADIPSPIFRSRPGWGGQLHTWWEQNAYPVLFRGALLLVLALLAWSGVVSVRQYRAAHSQRAYTPADSPQKPTIIYTFTAVRGQGMTAIAAQALNMRIATMSAYPALTREEYVFAVDRIARQAGWRPLSPGEHIEIADTDVVAAIDAAKRLTPNERAAWKRLVR